MKKGARAVQVFRDFRKPDHDFAGPLPYASMQSLFDALYPKGLQWYWKAHFVKELTDEALNVHVQHGNKLPTTHSTMHLYPINGACHKNRDTAFRAACQDKDKIRSG